VKQNMFPPVLCSPEAIFMCAPSAYNALDCLKFTFDLVPNSGLIKAILSF